MYSENYCSFLRKKFNRQTDIYGCPDVVPEMVSVPVPATTYTTTTTTTTERARHHHAQLHVPATTTSAQQSNSPQTGSAVGPVQISHAEAWTDLKIVGVTAGTLFLVYVDLNIVHPVSVCPQGLTSGVPGNTQK